MLRCELFVENADASIDFYRNVLEFSIVRREPNYCSLRRDDIVIGLGLIRNLPDDDPLGGFTKSSVRRGRGAGIEMVLEVDDLEWLYRKVRSKDDVHVVSLMQKQDWGLSDFRILDPDGYYLRISESVNRNGELTA